MGILNVGGRRREDFEHKRLLLADNSLTSTAMTGAPVCMINSHEEFNGTTSSVQENLCRICTWNSNPYNWNPTCKINS
jgi:hypothetical protein